MTLKKKIEEHFKEKEQIANRIIDDDFLTFRQKCDLIILLYDDELKESYTGRVIIKLLGKTNRQNIQPIDVVNDYIKEFRKAGFIEES